MKEFEAVHELRVNLAELKYLPKPGIWGTGHPGMPGVGGTHTASVENSFYLGKVCSVLPINSVMLH